MARQVISRNRKPMELGKKYRVNSISNGTYYTFENIEGQFLHFEGAPQCLSNGFLAISNEFPTEGKRFNCDRYENGCWVSYRTSIVKVVRQMAVNLFFVKTKNSIYFVEVS